MKLSDAQNLALELMQAFISAGAQRIDIVGSIRRKESEVGDLDFIAKDISGLRSLLDPPYQGLDKKLFGTYKGVNVNVWKADEESWGAAQFKFTGPVQYVVGWSMWIRSKGWILNESGVWSDRGHGVRLAGKTEQEIYKLMGKLWRPPEERGKDKRYDKLKSKLVGVKLEDV